MKLLVKVTNGGIKVLSHSVSKVVISWWECTIIKSDLLDQVYDARNMTLLQALENLSTASEFLKLLKLSYNVRDFMRNELDTFTLLLPDNQAFSNMPADAMKALTNVEVSLISLAVVSVDLSVVLWFTLKKNLHHFPNTKVGDLISWVLVTASATGIILTHVFVYETGLYFS